MEMPTIIITPVKNKDGNLLLYLLGFSIKLLLVSLLKGKMNFNWW